LIDVNKTAEDVYFVRGSYNSMFVVFNEYILVLEGPLNDALTEATLAAIKRIAPEKPIRYVVPTHYHHDHIGGLRPYIAEGATIVPPPGIVPEIEKLADAPRPLRRDSLSSREIVPKFETFTDQRIFSDEKHRVEIYNIGPTPHVADFMIGY